LFEPKKRLHRELLVFKDFLLFCNKQNLLSLKIVAIDGTKMRAQNGLNEVYNRETIGAVRVKIEEKINEYLQVLDENDQKEEEDLKSTTTPGGDGLLTAPGCLPQGLYIRGRLEKATAK
jgi:hypothetical protein